MQLDNVLTPLTEQKEEEIVADFRAHFAHDKIARASCGIDGRGYYLRDLTLVNVADLPVENMRKMYRAPTNIELTENAKRFYDLSGLDPLLSGM